jgi:cobalt/nickel transport system permease protein
VLTVQGLFFADGGLLALGCNIWNLGIYPCFIAYPLIYKPLAGDGKHSGRILVAALAGAIVALQMGAFSVVLETELSGKTELPFGTFLLLMSPVHLVIGAVEGLVTAGVVNYVRSVRPELLESAGFARPLQRSLSLRKILVVFGVLAVLIGGTLSWFASTHPDGLERAIERITGRTELPPQGGGVTGAAKELQGKTAIMPDYAFKQDAGATKTDRAAPSWPAVEPGTSVAGILGSVIVLVLVLVVGFTIRAVRRGRRHA